MPCARVLLVCCCSPVCVCECFVRFLAFFSRQEMFQQLHVRTASLALLSGNYLALNANQKGAAGQHF